MHELYASIKDWLFDMTFEGTFRGELAAFVLRHLPTTKTERELEELLFG